MLIFRQFWSVVVAQSGYSHQSLRWHSVRLVQQPILTISGHGLPVALPKGMVLFGPVAEFGEFATMMQDSEYYKCHKGELARYTTEIGAPAAELPQDKVA
jgi:hypothetical protein